MTELVQLERRSADFSSRNTRVIAISIEGLADASKTQADFPHLTVISDASRGLTEAADVLHPHVAPDGADADVPTTILVDRDGVVRWVYRSPAVMVRLSPDEVLRAVDGHLKIDPSKDD